MSSKAAPWLAACVAGGAALAAGCGGDARVELAAVEAVQSLAAAMDTAISEYHDDVERHDDHRESAVVQAFLDRVRASAGDEQGWNDHAAALERSLKSIRDDRATEWRRYAAARDNLALLRETADDLQRLALASLTLEDETRRYVLSILEAAGRARNNSGATERGMP